MTPEQAEVFQKTLKKLNDTRRESDEAWAALIDQVLVAAGEPTRQNVKDALDAEYELTGDCDGVSLLADALGYEDDELAD